MELTTIPVRIRPNRGTFGCGAVYDVQSLRGEDGRSKELFDRISGLTKKGYMFDVRRNDSSNNEGKWSSFDVVEFSQPDGSDERMLNDFYTVCGFYPQSIFACQGLWSYHTTLLRQRFLKQYGIKDHIKYLAFDCFNTVFDLNSVPHETVKEYTSKVKSDDEWSPLVLPDSWKDLKAKEDSATGISRLQSKFKCVAFSNGPQPLISEISKNAGINWDRVIALENHKVYKPKDGAYKALISELGCSPDEIMVVTANKEFGDLEGACRQGMHSMLIRYDDCPATVIALADLMQC